MMEEARLSEFGWNTKMLLLICRQSMNVLVVLFGFRELDRFMSL